MKATTIPTQKHVVMFSGGIGSWAAAKRVAATHGTENLTLLFTDTMMEDEDLYRFIDEAAANVGVPLTRIADGRTPWQVFEDERFIGNSRIDPCSKILKRKLFEKWRNANCTPEDTTIYVGIDWTEKHRLDRLQKYVVPWRYEAPLIAPPYKLKSEMIAELKAQGIKPPRLYGMGFAHNNCGGFCVKAGKRHFALLLSAMPERYAFHEAQEERLRGLGINGTILTQTINETKTPLTLREFRENQERVKGEQPEFDDDLAAGCGCALS